MNCAIYKREPDKNYILAYDIFMSFSFSHTLTATLNPPHLSFVILVYTCTAIVRSSLLFTSADFVHY